MMRCELTFEDMSKLHKAYRDLDKIIELIEERNRKKDIPTKPSGFVVDAHKCLREVLYGE